GPNGAPTYVRIFPGADPILTGLPTNQLEVQGSLYKCRNPAATVTPLMTGRLASGSEIEPVAWINTANHRRVFYTSLGTPDNFKQPFFRELLLNGISWALNRPIPPMLVQRPGGALISEPAAVKPQTIPTTDNQNRQAHPLTP